MRLSASCRGTIVSHPAAVNNVESSSFGVSHAEVSSSFCSRHAAAAAAAARGGVVFLDLVHPYLLLAIVGSWTP